MLNVVKIDSLKLRIPKYKVTYVDPTFAAEYVKVYEDSGLIDEHINLDKHKVDVSNGITTRIAVFHAVQGTMCEEQIVIQCNAKQLRGNYFLGINKNTIKDVYHYIMDLNIISVSFEDFLLAYISDIDVCYDVVVSPEAMREANREIYRNILPSMYKFVGNPFAKKTNTGLQFNIREKATPAKPYCKIYHKTLELQYKSCDFANTYLKTQNYENIGRLEYCIKNSKHQKHLGVGLRCLNDLLNIDMNVLERIIFSGVLSYIDKKTILFEYKDLSPTDRMILYFINKYISNGADKQSIYSVLNTYENPQERSRMKKKLTQLVENVDDQNRLVSNQETLNFLRVLKLDFKS
ncbi:hypothetical protein [Seonamhaeicola sp.]|uniref:hypothetical protein n=1 Tax=Seonamhaeicola sp. TaxID=1912245 RepID=UPI00262253A4|nr:hypothetical protein [Seonamhaeicola sp.]